ncbi:hypothetical protein [Pseudomonas chlororaphis]|uniref:hypothetical protein n=1 Tax=Pseudomonas chlororaphis TaxID=587753 RepID=UPI000F55F7E4|nr:hypothetical protein [Pseudomonas chlororaphis]
MSTLEPGKLPPLTDAQVQAGARPGETWEQARCRLEAANSACPPAPVDDHPGADYTLAGPVDECEGLDGQAIAWEDGELPGFR